MKINALLSLATTLFIISGNTLTIAEAGLFDGKTRIEKIRERAAENGMSFQQAFKPYMDAKAAAEATASAENAKDKPSSNSDDENDQDPGTIGQDGQGAGTNGNGNNNSNQT